MEDLGPGNVNSSDPLQVDTGWQCRRVTFLDGVDIGGKAFKAPSLLLPRRRGTYWTVSSQDTLWPSFFFFWEKDSPRAEEHQGFRIHCPKGFRRTWNWALPHTPLKRTSVWAWMMPGRVHSSDLALSLFRPKWLIWSSPPGGPSKLGRQPRLTLAPSHICNSQELRGKEHWSRMLSFLVPGFTGPYSM